MKINKEKLKELASLEDRMLRKEIISTAQKFGYTLPENALGEKELQKIRSVMLDADKISPMEIARLLSSVKAKRSKD